MKLPRIARAGALFMKASALEQRHADRFEKHITSCVSCLDGCDCSTVSRIIMARRRRNQVKRWALREAEREADKFRQAVS